MMSASGLEDHEKAMEVGPVCAATPDGGEGGADVFGAVRTGE